MLVKNMEGVINKLQELTSVWFLSFMVYILILSLIIPIFMQAIVSIYSSFNFMFWNKVYKTNTPWFSNEKKVVYENKNIKKNKKIL